MRRKKEKKIYRAPTKRQVFSNTLSRLTHKGKHYYSQILKNLRGILVSKVAADALSIFTELPALLSFLEKF